MKDISFPKQHCLPVLVFNYAGSMALLSLLTGWSTSMVKYSITTLVLLLSLKTNCLKMVIYLLFPQQYHQVVFCVSTTLDYDKKQENLANKQSSGWLQWF